MATWTPSFLINIDSIACEYPDADPLNGFWRPPRESTAFGTTSTSGLYRWFNGTLTGVRSFIHHSSLNRFSVVSVFYQSDTRRFLAIPTDCRDATTDGARHRWRQVGFEYPHNNNISILGCEAANNQNILAAPGSPTWMPQLLPAIYDRTPDLDGPEHDDSGGLAGSLALLIALAAFSIDPADMIDGIRHSFQVPQWRPHDGPTDGGSKIVRKP